MSRIWQDKPEEPRAGTELGNKVIEAAKGAGITRMSGKNLENINFSQLPNSTAEALYKDIQAIKESPGLDQYQEYQ